MKPQIIHMATSINKIVDNWEIRSGLYYTATIWPRHSHDMAVSWAYRGRTEAISNLPVSQKILAQHVAFLSGTESVSKTAIIIISLLDDLKLC